MRKSTAAFASMFSVASLILVQGCGLFTPNELVSKPSDITLDEAMKQVGVGLHDLYTAAHAGDSPQKSFGLSAQEVDITFNITATATGATDAKLTLDANAAPPALAVAGVKVGATGEIGGSNTSTASRGNTITVKLFNPIFAPQGTLIASCATQPAATQPSNDKPSSNIDAVLKAVQANQAVPGPSKPPKP